MFAPNPIQSRGLSVTAIAGIPRALKAGANSIPDDNGSTMTTGLFICYLPYVKC